jgi:hypothetical protein
MGQERWHSSEPRAWAEEKQRFLRRSKPLTPFWRPAEPLHASVERLLQGPVADALTHVGQLAMLRRLAGSPTRGENFFAAEIKAGQVGADQPAAARPFKAR